MSYVKLFADLAVGEDQRASALASELRSGLEAERRLDEIQEAWDEAAADGVVDSEELNRLRALFQQAGLGELPASEVSGRNLDTLDERVDKAIGRSRREAAKGNDLAKISLQLALENLTTYYDGASDALNREGEMYDNIVANLRG